MHSLTSIDDLKPHPRNPRKQEEKSAGGLKASLERFGDISGITWNRTTGRLVCGHQRVKQLKALGGQIINGAIQIQNGTKWPIRIVEMTEAEELAANVEANNKEIEGEFTEGLADLLPEIKSYLGDDEFGNLGLDGLEGLASKLAPPKDVIEDEVPEPPKVAVTKLGDVWQLGDHRVVCGDSTDLKAVGRLFGEEKAKFVFTDPPYGVDYDGGVMTPRERLAGDSGTELYGPACKMAFEFSDGKCALYLWHAGVKGIAAAAAAAAAGWCIRSEIVWNKNMAQFGALSAQYKQKHEPAYYCYKKGKSPRWHGPTNEVTVWDCDRASRNEFHPTQKPVEIAARAMKNSSAVGDLAADFFLGSGTTLIAAEQLNRKCFGVEIEPKYVDVIIERWENLTGGKAKRIEHGK